MDGNVSYPPEGSESSTPQREQGDDDSNSLLDALIVDEASMDPPGSAPQTGWKNSSDDLTKKSILFVLFEMGIEKSKIVFQFPEGCTSMFKLDFFAKASFHSSFLESVDHWRGKLSENETLFNRLFTQHQVRLQELTYPLPNRRGTNPIRKRGYRDKGSTRPNHERGRSDKDTVTAVHYLELQVVEKIRVYGRRPTVTYRRLPYSDRIRQVLELGLLEKVGDFYIPTTPPED